MFFVAVDTPKINNIDKSSTSMNVSWSPSGGRYPVNPGMDFFMKIRREGMLKQLLAF